MDIHKSLRDNLSYKTLIEYPVLHVVLRDQWKDYPLKGPGKKKKNKNKKKTVRITELSVLKRDWGFLNLFC